jgi:nuclease S1
MMKAAIATRALGPAFPVPALAWGGEGHRLVAEIAEQYLEPETARQVRELLAPDNTTTLAEVSTWADELRGQWRETAQWHYVTIPIRPR